MTENPGIRSVLWIANIDLQALQIWTATRCVDVRHMHKHMLKHAFRQTHESAQVLENKLIRRCDQPIYIEICPCLIYEIVDYILMC